jgi:hypothetical protein
LTQLSLIEITKAHLIGVPIRIGLVDQSSELNGYITGNFSKMIEFVSFEARTLWIPISQVDYMVVDKLSINSKV